MCVVVWACCMLANMHKLWLGHTRKQVASVQAAMEAHDEVLALQEVATACLLLVAETAARQFIGEQACIASIVRALTLALDNNKQPACTPSANNRSRLIVSACGVLRAAVGGIKSDSHQAKHSIRAAAGGVDSLVRVLVECAADEDAQAQCCGAIKNACLSCDPNKKVALQADGCAAMRPAAVPPLASMHALTE